MGLIERWDLAICPNCGGGVTTYASGDECLMCSSTRKPKVIEVVPSTAYQGAVDALNFALRTVTDSDLTEREVRGRIEGVVRRTLNVMKQSQGENHA